MSSVVISGDTSGAITLSAPAVAGTNTITLPASTGTVMVSGNMPAFSAYQGTGGSQSISATTYTKVTLDIEVFDTNSNFASNRFTPTVAGYYQVNWIVTTQSTSPTNYLFSDLYKNGADFCRGSLTIPQASSYGFSNGSQLVYMNGTTDYLEVYCWSSGATSLANNQQYTSFSGVLVRGA